MGIADTLRAMAEDKLKSLLISGRFIRPDGHLSILNAVLGGGVCLSVKRHAGTAQALLFIRARLFIRTAFGFMMATESNVPDRW